MFYYPQNFSIDLDPKGLRHSRTGNSTIIFSCLYTEEWGKTVVMRFSSTYFSLEHQFKIFEKGVKIFQKK